MLNAEEEISERNLKALRAARAAGFSIILATARWYQLAARVAAEAGAVGPIVACSGAQVRLPRGHDLLDLRLPAEFFTQRSA